MAARTEMFLYGPAGGERCGRRDIEAVPIDFTIILLAVKI